MNQTINWFHQVLIHPGSSRLFATLKQHYYFPNMLQQIEDHTNKCEHCIKNKHPSVKYGELPLRKLPTLQFMKWLWILLDPGKSLSMAFSMNSVPCPSLTQSATLWNLQDLTTELHLKLQEEWNKLGSTDTQDQSNVSMILEQSLWQSLESS